MTAANTKADRETDRQTHARTQNLQLANGVIQEEGSIFWEMAESVTVRKISSFEHVSNSDWLPRYSCLNLHNKESKLTYHYFNFNLIFK
jgi:hypothetical protein